MAETFGLGLFVIGRVSEGGNLVLEDVIEFHQGIGAFG